MENEELVGQFAESEINNFSEETVTQSSQVFLINQDPDIVVYYSKVNTATWTSVNPPIPRNCQNTDATQCRRDGNYDFLCYAPQNEPNTAIWIAYRKKGGPLKNAYWAAGIITAARVWAAIPPGKLG